MVFLQYQLYRTLYFLLKVISMQKPSRVVKIKIVQTNDPNQRSNNPSKSISKLSKIPSSISIAKKSEQLQLNKMSQPIVNKNASMKVPIKFTIPLEPYHFSQQSDFGIAISNWLVELMEYSSSNCESRALTQRLSQQQIVNIFCKTIMGHIKEFGQSLKDLKVQTKFNIIVFLDKTTKQIMKQYLPKYAPLQFNNFSWINQLNLELVDFSSDQFDFLVNNELSFQYIKYQNYTPYIMTVINKIVDVQNQFADDFSSTYSQKFRYICERISTSFFKGEAVHQRSKTLSRVSPAKHKQNNINKKSLRRLPRSSSRVVTSMHQNFDQKQKQVIKFNNDEISNVERVKVAALSKHAKPLFDHKFGYHIKKFTQQQLILGDFSCNNSLIYKILQMWVYQLEKLIYNCEEEIKLKMTKFKTHSGKFISLLSYQKKILLKYISQEKKMILSQLQSLKTQYKILQTSLIQQKSFGKFIKSQANLGVFCSKMQEAIGQYLLRYLNKLIHILLLATMRASNAPIHFYPQHISPDQVAQSRERLKSLNLVTFKIYDLFYAKFRCTQTNFSSMVQEIIELSREKVIKIVQIKNSQDHASSSLILNIFFQNKLKGQLHLVIHKQNQIRQSLNYALYSVMNKIINSKFGAFSQLSCTITQYDPIIKNYCQYNHNGFSLRKSVNVDAKTQMIDMRMFMKQLGIKISMDKPFICDQCGELKTVINPKMFNRISDWDLFVCNQCKEVEIRSSQIEAIKYFVSVVNQNAKIAKYLEHKLQYLNLINVRSIDFHQIPKFGFFIPLYSKVPVVKPFKIISEPNSSLSYLITLNHKNKPETLMQICQNQTWANQFDKILLYDVDISVFGWADDSGFIPYLEGLLKSLDKFQSEALNASLKLKNFLQSLKAKENMLFMNANKGLCEEIAKYLGQIQAESSFGIQMYLAEGYNQSKQAKHLRRKRQFSKLAVETKILQMQDCGLATIFSFVNDFSRLKELNFTNNQIKVLENIDNLNELQQIILDRNKIVDFSYLGKLPYLKIINLNNNSIISFPHEAKFQNLYHLSLRNNQINSLKGLQLMPNLIELDLSGNKIALIQNLQEPKKLKILKLKNNNIIQIQGLQQLQYLQQLIISDNKIQYINNLKQLINLKLLDLSNNQIKAITGLQCLHQLKKLFISGNQIRVIQNINHLKKLKRLKLNHNKIQQFDGLQGLIYLIELDISFNQIVQIYNIQQMNIDQLTFISLNNNKLRACPQLTSLRQLTKVDLSFNKITKITGLNKLHHLMQLNLSHNLLQKIQNLQSLTSLSTLNLSYNDILQMQGLQKLVKLQMLYLGCNQLKQIKGLDNLQQLQTLLLNNNIIKYLSGLQKLVSLKNLNVSNNQITDCQGIQLLTKLQVLFVNFNHIKQLNLPQTISELCVLKASSNQIEKVPDLSMFQKLKRVFLQMNEITQLNIDQLLAMKSLECINLENNHFIDHVVLYRNLLGNKIMIN